MDRVWRPLLAFAFGLLLALALDQTVRLVLPPEPTVEGRPWYLQTVQYHPILGWSGYPNYRETNDGIRIQTNSLGYRDREPLDVVDGQKLRVLFLGDSFTWGDEVKVEDRFTSLLEASCGPHCDLLPPIHAINKAIIGYGTAQSFAVRVGPKRRPVRYRHSGPVHGERPPRQRRRRQSEWPPASVDSMRTGEIPRRAMFGGCASSPGYRLAGTSTDQSA